MRHFPVTKRISLKVNQHKDSANLSRGVAAVEAALVLPVLILVTLSAIDISQYITFSQSISNASREGARLVSRSRTSSQSEVEAALNQYLANTMPNVSSKEILEGLVVEIRHGSDNILITDGNLAAINSGDPVSIRIAFDYSVIRWLNGPDYWGGNMRESTTFCRRE